MYICACNAVTEKQVQQAIEGGAQSVGQLREKLMVARCCGSCLDSVKQCLQQAATPQAA